MLHRIPIERWRDDLGDAVTGMAEAVDSCVHCGFCLPTCPTYVTLEEEMDSPRGRIVLMKSVLEGELAIDEVLPHIDPCLGCLACHTSCPSGVRYEELLVPFRGLGERQRGGWRRWRRRLLLRALTSRRLLRWLVAPARGLRPLRRLLPARLAAPLALLPAPVAKGEASREPDRSPRTPKRTGRRVLLLRGCAQEALAPEIHRATVRVLEANGVEVVVAAGQRCCGALAYHAGELEMAKALATEATRAFVTAASECEAVVTDAAGCGSMLQQYGNVLAGSPLDDEACGVAERAVDVSAFLATLELHEPRALRSGPLRVAYQDPCHLAHAQGVRSAPRELLQRIPGLELVEPVDWEICCGSAGLYNLEQPSIAAKLGSRKADSLLATGAEIVATGNVGCLVQLRRHLEEQAERGRPAPAVCHTVELLAQAYG